MALLYRMLISNAVILLLFGAPSLDLLMSNRLTPDKLMITLLFVAIINGVSLVFYLDDLRFIARIERRSQEIDQAYKKGRLDEIL